MCVLAMGLVLAAAPLFWFDLDPKAGDKLLKWTSSSAYAVSLR